MEPELVGEWWGWTGSGQAGSGLVWLEEAWRTCGCGPRVCRETDHFGTHTPPGLLRADLSGRLVFFSDSQFWTSASGLLVDGVVRFSSTRRPERLRPTINIFGLPQCPHPIQFFMSLSLSTPIHGPAGRRRRRVGPGLQGKLPLKSSARAHLGCLELFEPHYGDHLTQRVPALAATGYAVSPALGER